VKNDPQCRDEVAFSGVIGFVDHIFPFSPRPKTRNQGRNLYPGWVRLCALVHLDIYRFSRNSQSEKNDQSAESPSISSGEKKFKRPRLTPRK
jgi:hypothetical protein